MSERLKYENVFYTLLKLKSMKNKKYDAEIEFIKKHLGGVLLNDFNLMDLIYFMNKYKEFKTNVVNYCDSRGTDVKNEGFCDVCNCRVEEACK